MQFHKFIELAKDGIIHRSGKILRLTDQSKEHCLETVPFIFTAEEGTKTVEHLELDDPLDLPFKTCFFEILERPLSEIEENGETICLDGLWVHETAPKTYELLAILRFPKQEMQSLCFADAGPLQDHFLKIIKSLLTRLAKDEVGFNNPRTSIKMRIRGEKVQKRLSRIVYVAPKRQTATLAAASHKEIDWSHRWTVRGHWRDIPGRIGKDRDGAPLLNHTWVRDYAKGPANAPLVAKTRIIRGEA